MHRIAKSVLQRSRCHPVPSLLAQSRGAPTSRNQLDFHRRPRAVRSFADDASKNRAGEKGGFWSSLRERIENEIEKNPELKQSLEELSTSKVSGDKTVSEAARNLGKAATETKASLGRRAEEIGKQADDVKQAFAKSEATDFAEEQVKKTASKVGAASEYMSEMFGRTRGAVEDAMPEETLRNVKSAGNTASSVSGKLGAGVRGVFEALPTKLSSSDEQTWENAARELFGLRPKAVESITSAESNESTSAGGEEDDATGSSTIAIRDEDGELWYETKDDDSGDVYYYTEGGQTSWEKPHGDVVDAKPAAAPAGGSESVPTPEEEAQAWAESQRNTGPSLYETQIAERAAKIEILEEERSEALTQQDMAKYKELNSEVRKLRDEIEAIAAKANTNAVVAVEEERGAWDKFSEGLRDLPLIKGVFGLGDTLGVGDTARKAREAAEDAREAIETSQNPWVYRAYSAWDSLFAETEMGECLRAIRKVDRNFTMDQFIRDMEEIIIPDVLGAFLRADKATLERYCQEAAAGAVKASIAERINAKRRMDPNILAIDHTEVMAAQVIDKVGPVMVVQFMAQQINCLYDLEGNVVEGRDDDVAAVFYAFAMTREWDEETSDLQWKVVEFAIIGRQPWL